MYIGSNKMKTSSNGHLRRPFALYFEICPLFNHEQNANVLKNNGVENIIISRGILMKGNTKGNAVYHIWRSGIMTKSHTEKPSANTMRYQCWYYQRHFEHPTNREPFSNMLISVATELCYSDKYWCCAHCLLINFNIIGL